MCVESLRCVLSTKGLKVLKRWPSSIIDTCKSFLKLSLEDKKEAIVVSIVSFCSDIVLTYDTAQFLVSFFPHVTVTVTLQELQRERD